MEVKKTIGEGGVACVLVMRAEGKGTEEASMVRPSEPAILSSGSSWSR